jgi:hypothetical protein
MKARGEKRCSSTLSLTSALDGVGGERHALAALLSGKIPDRPIVQETGRTTGPVWTGAEKLVSTEIQSPNRSARSESVYLLSYYGPQSTGTSRICSESHNRRTFSSPCAVFLQPLNYVVCLKSKCTDFLFNYLLDLSEITSYLLRSMTLGKLHSGFNVSSTNHSSIGSHFP